MGFPIYITKVCSTKSLLDLLPQPVAAENCWACHSPRPEKPSRIIVRAMKNSPALRYASAQSVTKGACWSLRSCREAYTGRWRSGIPRDEEDRFRMQIKSTHKLGWAKP